jgi:cytochrome P450
MFEGFRLPKNWLVRICVAECHRDAGTFADPDRFDPDRFLNRDYPRTAYSPFGMGRHACNGVPLAMGIAHAFFEELTRSFDWTVDGHGLLERDFRHWSHWRPARTMRLVLNAPVGDGRGKRRDQVLS